MAWNPAWSPDGARLALGGDAAARTLPDLQQFAADPVSGGKYNPVRPHDHRHRHVRITHPPRVFPQHRPLRRVVRRDPPVVVGQNLAPPGQRRHERRSVTRLRVPRRPHLPVRGHAAALPSRATRLPRLHGRRHAIHHRHAQVQGDGAAGLRAPDAVAPDRSADGLDVSQRGGEVDHRSEDGKIITAMSSDSMTVKVMSSSVMGCGGRFSASRGRVRVREAAGSFRIDGLDELDVLRGKLLIPSDAEAVGGEAGVNRILHN